MEHQQVHIFNLTEENLEEIASHLELIDLKFLSESCRYFNEITSKFFGVKSRLNIMKQLTFIDTQIFKNSRRKYNSAFIKTSNLDVFESNLKQLATLPSIDLKSIEIPLREYESDIKRIAEFLKSMVPNLKEICLNIPYFHQYYHKIEPVRMISIFGGYKLSYKVTIPAPSHARVSFDHVNELFNHPKSFDICRDSKNISFRKDVENVEELSMYVKPKTDMKFKNIKSLTLGAELNYLTFKSLINSNQESLTELSISNILKLDWNVELPCQLRTFSNSFPCDKKGEMNTSILRNQKNLRNVKLRSTKITNDLLEVLSANKGLTSFEMVSCFPDSALDSEKFSFLKSVASIRYYQHKLQDSTLVKSLLINADNVVRMRIEISGTLEDSEPVYIKKKLNNLKVLEIEGEQTLDYLLKIVEIPKIEVNCVFLCAPQLSGYKDLKNLKVLRELSYEQVVEILETFQSLETFHFDIHVNFMEQTLRYILGYILGHGRNIRHFQMYLTADKLEDHDPDSSGDPEEDIDHEEMAEEIVKPILEEFGLSCEIMHLTYYTEVLSFEICSLYTNDFDSFYRF